MTRLTESDRRRIAQARRLAAANGHDEIREHLIGRGLLHRQYEDRELFPFALGVAQQLLGDLADLAERLGGDEGQAAEPEDDHWRDYNYACSTCGAQIGIFEGHVGGWRHYRGSGTVANPVEIFDAGHEATVTRQLQEGELQMEVPTGSFRALTARLLAWLLPRGSGRHVTMPGPEAPDPDATVIFPRIPDDGPSPADLTVFDNPPVRARPYVQGTEEDR